MLMVVPAVLISLKWGADFRGLSGQCRYSKAMHRGDKTRAHLFLGQESVRATAVGDLLVGVARDSRDKYYDDSRPPFANG
jgi:hypothetical protein